MHIQPDKNRPHFESALDRQRHESWNALRNFKTMCAQEVAEIYMRVDCDIGVVVKILSKRVTMR